MILMYHHIAPVEAIPEQPTPLEGWEYRLSPVEFEGQLVQLQARGYQFISLADLVSEIKRTGSEPARAVALTFDDGWLDNFTHAWPVLQRLRLPATFFVTTEHLRRADPDPRRMSAEQLLELTRAGMTLGGHSRSHPNLAALTEANAREEIAGCKRDLEDLTGAPVRFFSYPFGAHTAVTRRLAKEAGFEAACSAGGGATNTREVLFELYRDILSPTLDAVEDRKSLSGRRRRIAYFWRRSRAWAVLVAKTVIRKPATR